MHTYRQTYLEIKYIICGLNNLTDDTGRHNTTGWENEKKTYSIEIIFGILIFFEEKIPYAV